MVGMSGKSEERFLPVTAIAFSRPAFTNGSAEAVPAKYSSPWPPTVAVIAGTAPL
jgi:hypothetical protein